MGYDIHIVRNDDFWDEEIGGGISLDEWSSYVAQDNTMRMDGTAEVDLPNESKLIIESEGLAVWTAYAANEVGGNQAWFGFHNNAIVVKNPDQQILAKMLEIAASLNAKVLGDEGEQYEFPNDHGVPKHEVMQELLTEPTRPWWKFW